MKFYYNVEYTWEQLKRIIMAGTYTLEDKLNNRACPAISFYIDNYFHWHKETNTYTLRNNPVSLTNY